MIYEYFALTLLRSSPCAAKAQDRLRDFSCSTFRNLTKNIQRSNTTGVGIGGKVEDVVDKRLDCCGALECQLPHMHEFCGRCSHNLDHEDAFTVGIAHHVEKAVAGC
jgi:hypothetical protein